MSPLLQVNNLQLAFTTGKGSKPVLHGISFTVEQGKTLALVGESGSGKTVTSLLVMGLISQKIIAARSGEVLFSTPEGTKDLLHAGEDTFRKIRGKEIAMIFQEPMTALNPSYTCGDQLLEGIRLHRRLKGAEAREAAIALLKEVELHDTERMLKSYPHQLSGGQRQRIMIAMALSGNPRLLIADEPTTALDATVQASILELLGKLQVSRNMSIIFISHDLGVVQKVAHQVLVMYKGQQAELNDTASLFANPGHPYTKALLYCRPSGQSRAYYLPTIPDIMDVSDGVFTEKEFRPRPLGEHNTEADQGSLQYKPEEHYFVEAQHISIAYTTGGGFSGKKKKRQVVKSVSFHIKKGETLGLVGESGSGKTSIGRAVVRLNPLSGGEILINDPGIAAGGRPFARVAQIIFQDPFASLNPRIRVGDAILEPMKVHNLLGNDKARKQRVLSLLQEVGLADDHYNSYPHELSGGQRQRVCIARCLALEPELIVCDESVAALDVSVQAQVLNLLRKLQTTYGLTYLFISHDLNVIRYMCDRVIVLKQGEIVESGDTESLFSRPQQPYTKELLGTH